MSSEVSRPYTDLHLAESWPDCFVGNATSAANWAVGVFVLGSMASYEWCQYLRREERRQMKRQIEVVSENRREQAKKIAEARQEHARLEAEKKAAEKAWYKFW